MSSNGAGGSSPATNKPSPTAATKPSRLPAPSLFVGPPSRNASQLSIARPSPHDAAKPTRDPLNRQKSLLSRPTHTGNEPADGEAAAAAHHPGISSAGGGGGSDLPPLAKASEKSLEAKWKELQSTLNEVELSAQSSSHVFGESHAAALDELRAAQVELARAWGRGGGGGDGGQDSGVAVGPENVSKPNVGRFKGAEDLAAERPTGASRKRADTQTSASTALSDESRPSGATSRGGRSRLEDETALDIKLASERRGANEAYFKKVDGGVRDVVAKLGVVAEAMRGVESESRSLWSSSSDAFSRST